MVLHDVRAFPRPLIRQTSAGQDQEGLLSTVRAAAEHLIADLERAKQLTGDWADEKLTEVLAGSALSSCLHELAKTGCWGEANRIASNEFWRIAGPILEVGVLQHRARFKPRATRAITRCSSGSRQTTAVSTPWAVPLIGTSKPRRRRWRSDRDTERVAAILVAHALQTAAADFHVVSVGAGPASDIYQGLCLLPKDRRGRVRATLLDLDPEALEFVRQQLEPLLPPGALECKRENLYRLPRGQPLELASDFLVCSGLFDYLEDDTAVEMLRLFWQWLAEGGVMLVGNFAPHNPTRAYMEWIGNWYLTYRTTEDLERLALRAEIPKEHYSITSEPLGVDLFLLACKREG